MSIYFVSVIIPVYNDSTRLYKCLNALEHQSYPQDSYEIIVVDNNSSENIELITAQFELVRLERESIPGSYAARNKGIAVAKGEILAFIDSDCLPVAQWLENGVKTLESQAADLVGGEVTFTFSPRRSLAEVYDSVTNMQIKQNIAMRQVSKTANLFTRKHVFDSIGLFPSSLKSGGDVIWTKAATDANFKLVYSPTAQVYHPARKLFPLLKKQYRVGKGQPDIWLEQGQTLKQIFLNSLNSFRPPSPKDIRRFAEERNIVDAKEQFFSFWLTAWLYNTATNLGRIDNVIKRAIFTK